MLTFVKLWLKSEIGKKKKKELKGKNKKTAPKQKG